MALAEEKYLDMNDTMIVSGQQKGCAPSGKIIPYYLSDRCNKKGIEENVDYRIS